MSAKVLKSSHFPVTEPVEVTATRPMKTTVTEPNEVTTTRPMKTTVTEPTEVTAIGIKDITRDWPPKSNCREQASAHLKVN